MKPPAFDLVMAGDWDEALDALSAEAGDARVLAGGQSLVAMLNMRIAAPSVLVDINRIAGADAITLSSGAVRVGATARQRGLERHGDAMRALPLVAEALPHVGHVQTRSRGTVCGSLAHADPTSELPLCLLALEGRVDVRSRRARRRIEAADFFTGIMSTALAPDEIIMAAEFPAARPDYGYAFAEVAERHGDFALAAFAAIAGPDFLRLAVGGAADRPVARTWKNLAASDMEDALNAFAWDLGGVGDHHADARYRRDLVRTIGLRTLHEAQRRRASGHGGGARE